MTPIQIDLISRTVCNIIAMMYVGGFQHTLSEHNRTILDLMLAGY